MKVLSISPSFGHFDKSPLGLLEQSGFEVDLWPASEQLTMDEVLMRVAAYNALIPGTFPITAELLDAAPKLKLLALASAGFDNIDLKAATERGIVITNCPAANHQAVAELAIGFMFALARKITHADAEVKVGGWPRLVGRQIGGKTLGIVGMGRIGKEVAKMALALGMKVVAFDIFPDKAFSKQFGVKFCDLKELMALADFVSLHVVSTDKTAGMIDEKMLREMKPTAYLVNLSRGRVLDESALYKVLSDGAIAGAGLDVFVDEPPSPDHPLLTLSNVITTPHMGGYTYEAVSNTGMTCAHSIIDFYCGRIPENIVNQAAFEMYTQKQQK